MSSQPAGPPVPGLVHVTPRLLLWRASRASASALATYLERRYPGSSLLVNLTSHSDTAASPTVDVRALHGAVSEWPASPRPGALRRFPPAIGTCFRFSYSLAFWHAWGPETVAIIAYDARGSERALVMAAAYVHWSGGGGGDALPAGAGMAGALARITAVAAAPEAWLPSARSCMRGFERLCARPPALPRLHALEYVVVHLPRVREELERAFGVASSAAAARAVDAELATGGGARSAGAAAALALPASQQQLLPSLRYPVLQVFSATGGCVWDSSSDCLPDETLRWEGDDLLAELPTPLALCGDYELWVMLPPCVGSGPAAAVAIPSGLDADYASALAAAASSTSAFDVRRLVAATSFHSSLLDRGVAVIDGADCDVFSTSRTPDLRVTLVLGSLPPEREALAQLGGVQLNAYVNLAAPVAGGVGAAAGLRALSLGATIFSQHHHCFPLPASLALMQREGWDPLAVACSLQRADNAVGRAREVLDCSAFHSLFVEPHGEREMRLLRETLTRAEIASVLAQRTLVAVKRRGPHLSELDFSTLLEAARLDSSGGGGSGARGGAAVAAAAVAAATGAGGGGGSGGTGHGGGGDGSGGGGDGGGFGGGGGGGRRHGKKRAGGGKGGGGSSESGGSRGDEGSGGDVMLEEDAGSTVAPAAPAAAPGALFAGTGDANDECGGGGGGAEGPEEEEAVGPWRFSDHPVFGRWHALLASGKDRAQLLSELAAEGWAAAALLAVPIDAEVPDAMPATTVTRAEWVLLAKFRTMGKVGLPLPIIAHAMEKEGLSALLLEAGAGVVLARDVSPPRKGGGKKKGPNVKRLHWTPIRGPIAGTVWAGPPGDLAGASERLIVDETEFTRLFVEDPKKRATVKAQVALLDARRAMNVAISIAKLHVEPQVVVDCLTHMSARASTGQLLSRLELANLGALGGWAVRLALRLAGWQAGGNLGACYGEVTTLRDPLTPPPSNPPPHFPPPTLSATLVPSDDEVRTFNAFKGDVKLLNPPERFMLLLSSVPSVAAIARGLHYQATFDERVGDARARVATFEAACTQLLNAQRFQRFLKSVLVLGNRLCFGPKVGWCAAARTAYAGDNTHTASVASTPRPSLAG